MTPYQGDESNVPDDKQPFSINILEDSDRPNGALFNAVFQALMDRVAKLWAKAARTNLTNIYSLLQTFNGGISTTTLGASGAITGASLNTGSGAIGGGPISGSSLNVGSGAINGGAVSGTTGTFTGNVSSNGVVNLAGAPAPSATTAYSNTLTRANIPRAWGIISINSGTVTLEEGFNIASAAISGDNLYVNLASNMASTSYVVLAQTTISNVSSTNASVGTHSRAVGSFGIRFFTSSNAAITNLSSGVYAVSFVVFARQ